MDVEKPGLPVKAICCGGNFPPSTAAPWLKDSAAQDLAVAMIV